MKTRLFFTFLAIVLLQGIGSTQQLPEWSSFYENAFVWNPATTARWSSWELSATHRQNWTGFDDAPTTSFVGFQVPVLKLVTETTFGGYVYHDQVGPFSQIGVGGTYTFKSNPKWFDNYYDSFSIGIAANANQYHFNSAGLTGYNGTNDPQIINAENLDNKILPNLGVGIFYQSVSDYYNFKSHWFSGLAVTNLVPFKLAELPVNTDGSLSPLSSRPHINAHGGFRHFPFKKKYFYETNLMINYAIGRATEVMLNLRYESVERYWVSVGTVTDGEVFGQAGLILGNDSPIERMLKGGEVRLGFKVDYSLGTIRRYAGIGYEMYVAYSFRRDSR